ASTRAMASWIGCECVGSSLETSIRNGLSWYVTGARPHSNGGATGETKNGSGLGDDWQHDIVVEDVLPADPTVHSPHRLGGPPPRPPRPPPARPRRAAGRAAGRLRRALRLR